MSKKTPNYDQLFRDSRKYISECNYLAILRRIKDQSSHPRILKEVFKTLQSAVEHTGLETVHNLYTCLAKESFSENGPLLSFIDKHYYELKLQGSVSYFRRPVDNVEPGSTDHPLSIVDQKNNDAVVLNDEYLSAFLFILPFHPTGRVRHSQSLLRSMENYTRLANTMNCEEINLVYRNRATSLLAKVDVLLNSLDGQQTDHIVQINQKLLSLNVNGRNVYYNHLFDKALAKHKGEHSCDTNQIPCNEEEADPSKAYVREMINSLSALEMKTIERLWERYKTETYWSDISKTLLHKPREAVVELQKLLHEYISDLQGVSGSLLRELHNEDLREDKYDESDSDKFSMTSVRSRYEEFYRQHQHKQDALFKDAEYKSFKEDALWNELKVISEIGSNSTNDQLNRGKHLIQTEDGFQLSSTKGYNNDVDVVRFINGGRKQLILVFESIAQQIDAWALLDALNFVSKEKLVVFRSLLHRIMPIPATSNPSAQRAAQGKHLEQPSEHEVLSPCQPRYVYLTENAYYVLRLFHIICTRLHTARLLCAVQRADYQLRAVRNKIGKKKMRESGRSNLYSRCTTELDDPNNLPFTEQGLFDNWLTKLVESASKQRNRNKSGYGEDCIKMLGLDGYILTTLPRLLFKFQEYLIKIVEQPYTIVADSEGDSGVRVENRPIPAGLESKCGGVLGISIDLDGSKKRDATKTTSGKVALGSPKRTGKRSREELAFPESDKASKLRVR